MMEAVAAKRPAPAKILSVLSIFTPTTVLERQPKRRVRGLTYPRILRAFICPQVPPPILAKIGTAGFSTSARNSVDRMAKELRAAPC